MHYFSTWEIWDFFHSVKVNGIKLLYFDPSSKVIFLISTNYNKIYYNKISYVDCLLADSQRN